VPRGPKPKDHPHERRLRAPMPVEELIDGIFKAGPMPKVEPPSPPSRRRAAVARTGARGRARATR